MTEPGLKVSASSLSGASAGRARNPDTLARLQALDKNGDGKIDLNEVCDAIDEIVRKEKTERTLKWLLAALALFSLLTIAATVGLTFAVVELSKDTKVGGSVLQSKDTGEALRTGSFLQSQNATALAAAVVTSNDPSAVLGRITSIKVPSLKEGEAYTVHKVDAVTMLRNRSVLVRTAVGLDVLMPGDGLMPPKPPTRRNGTNVGQGSGRKLLAPEVPALTAGTSACVSPFVHIPYTWEDNGSFYDYYWAPKEDIFGNIKEFIYAKLRYVWEDFEALVKNNKLNIEENRLSSSDKLTTYCAPITPEEWCIFDVYLSVLVQS